MFGEVPDAIKLEDVFVMNIGDQRFKLALASATKATVLAIYSLSAGKRDPQRGAGKTRGADHVGQFS